MDDTKHRLPHCESEEVSVPLAQTLDWSIEFLGIPGSWQKTAGEGVKVCVLDTGYPEGHPDLRGAFDSGSVADFTQNRGDGVDRNGHGSWCLGMIGARANTIGVKGIAHGCRLASGKVLGDSGGGTSAAIVNGIAWAVSIRADVISMSFGAAYEDAAIREAVERASQAGCMMFFAAGNNGKRGSMGWPARWASRKWGSAIGACDKRGERAMFSSWGPELTVIAPGVEMLSLAPNGRYAILTGTSMATPVAAAIGALAIAKHRKEGGATDLKTNADMQSHIVRGARDIGQPGYDEETGYGLINPAGVLMDEKPPEPPPKPPEIVNPPLLQCGPYGLYSPARAGDLFSLGTV